VFCLLSCIIWIKSHICRGRHLTVWSCNIFIWVLHWGDMGGLSKVCHKCVTDIWKRLTSG
jgi:hypothetical protein